MKLTRIKLERFTAFKKLDLELSPGVNIFIGANGTGKTHLLKVAYSACDVTRSKGGLAGKLVRVFQPYQKRVGRLVHRTGRSTRAVAEVYRGSLRIRSSFSNHTTDPASAKVAGRARWVDRPISCAYIPVKEMLAHAPGFRSLYSSREIHFEEIYADIVDRAFLPVLRGPRGRTRSRLLKILQASIDGKVISKKETFFLKNRQGELEFTLLAEGLRKLALLWLLIQNGTVVENSVLFWDEPETNLNPEALGTLVSVLLELQRMDVQILLATHNYVLLKEFDLRMEEDDEVRFHALGRDGDGVIQARSTNEYLEVRPNRISDTYLDLYDRDVRRDLE